MVQLARDLQTDFYPHFPDFFTLITLLLDTKDTELLEWAFTSLSYLYKYLWRLMVKDMSNIYKSVLRLHVEQLCSPLQLSEWCKHYSLCTLYSLYSTLLEHKKEHIRKFAAESFSFLMRKVSYSHDRRILLSPLFVCFSVMACTWQVPDIDSLLSHIFADLNEHPSKAEGAGQLLFEMCKGVRNMFHSCADKVSGIASWSMEFCETSCLCR